MQEEYWWTCVLELYTSVTVLKVALYLNYKKEKDI